MVLFLVFALPKYLSEGFSFLIPQTAILWFLWSWKEFSRIHLVAPHIIPVGIFLILQINLLKSTKKWTPLLSSHEIFHWSYQHFHVCSNNCICLFNDITVFQPRKLDIAFWQNIASAQTEKCHKSKCLRFCIAKCCIGFLKLQSTTYLR